MADFAVQRTNMVDSQVRPSDVTDRRIPRAMLEVPREMFVPAAKRAIAYMDGPIPLGAGDASGATAERWVMAPRLLSKLVQNLEVGPESAVLHIGCNTGYGTAVLAHLARSVVAVEVDVALAERARAALREAGVTNATVETGSLAAGLASKAPYDAILVEGGIVEMPASLVDQLKDGGRLVAVLVERSIGKATLWRRYGMQVDHRALFDANAAVLPGFTKEAGFVF
jgi:protein-L-isoaspartate(D-aspartate) O-methyltransferase